MKRSKNLLALTTALGLSTAAHSALILTATESGGNVVISGGGSVNTASLFNFGATPYTNPVFVFPSDDSFLVGTSPANRDNFAGGIIEPVSFGSGPNTLADNSTGDLFGIFGGDTLILPAGYVSSNILSGTATFNSTNFATLGMTLGSYTWNWGAGANADSLTLNIGGSPATIPAPLPLALLATGGLIGLSLRKKLKA